MVIVSIQGRGKTLLTGQYFKEGLLMEGQQNQDKLKPLVILNDRPSRGGAGRYASQLYEASSSFSVLISSVWMAQEKRLEFPGYRFDPKFDNLPYFIDRFQAYTSHIFPQLFRRDYFEYVKETKRRKGFIHYSSHLIKPIHSDDRDVVSFLDAIGLEALTRQPINYLINRSFLKFQNILTLSHTENEKIAFLSHNSQPITIHPYVSKSFYRFDKATARKKVGIETEKHVVLSVSIAQPRKNLKIIPKVMETLGENYMLIRVGPRLGSEMNFVNVSDETLNYIYNAADVFFFPTLAEGFGYPLVEAMAVGLPIVSSDIPVVREITDGAAVLTDPLSISELANSIRDLVNDPRSVAEKEIERSRYFTFERFSRELQNFYKKIGVFD